MKRYKKNIDWNEVITISSLTVAILSLTIIFTMYSKVIKINHEIRVRANEATFGVKLTSKPNVISNELIYPSFTIGATGDTATISNTPNSTISGLKAYFTAPGQTVTYKLYVRNTGEYKAHLTDIIYDYVEGSNVTKMCIAQKSMDLDLLQDSCDKISVNVSVNGTVTNKTLNNISNNILDTGYSNEIIITIKYDKSAKTVEVPFNIKFGDIHLIYQ